MHIRAVAAAALLLVPSIAVTARVPAVPVAVGGSAPYRLVLSSDAPTPSAGGTVTVTLTVTRPPTDGSAPAPVDPAAPLSIVEKAIGIGLTSTGGSTILTQTLTGCAEVTAGVCRLHGEVGVTSTVTFGVDVPAGAADAVVQAAITEHRIQNGSDFFPTVDPATSESAELPVGTGLATGTGFAVTYSPEVVAPGGVVRVRIVGLPADGEYRLVWSQGVAPVGPFRAVGGVIDASFPIMQFDPLGPRTLLVGSETDLAAPPAPTTSRVPLLVVPGSTDPE